MDIKFIDWNELFKKPPPLNREQKKGSECDDVKHQHLLESKEERSSDCESRSPWESRSSDCESVSSFVSFNSDKSMSHPIDFKGSPSVLKRMEDKFMMTDWNELFQKPYSYIAPFNREQKKGSECDEVKHQPLLESKEEGSSDCESVSSCVSFKSDRSMSHFIDFKDSRPSALKRMENKLSNLTHLTKEREDALMAQIKSMENKLSNMADRMKEREDAMMTQMKLMENKLSDMADRMKEREDANMAHMKFDQSMNRHIDFKGSRPPALKRKRKLEEEGSDSTEPEPREESSSRKSSYDSVSSDRSMKRLIDFKDSGPSAPKRKRLEDEGSDSTESEPEPREEPSSDTD